MGGCISCPHPVRNVKWKCSACVCLYLSLAMHKKASRLTVACLFLTGEEKAVGRKAEPYVSHKLVDGGLIELAV